MEFKKEVFEGEEVMINLRFKITSDTRKILRLLDIYDRNNCLVVKITSNGGFLDLEKRKIVEPPKRYGYMSQIFERVGFAILQYRCLKASKDVR